MTTATQIDARLDLILFANGLRSDASTPGGDADLMTYLIGDLCEFRESPVETYLTNRRRAVLQAYDSEHYGELASKHGWPLD